MRWIFSTLLLAGSAYFLFSRYAALNTPAPLEPVERVAPPLVLPRPFLPPADLEKVRANITHHDPGVRWTALELLYTMGDPESYHHLERAVAKDLDSEIRMKAVKLLGSGTGAGRVPGLARALRDREPEIRMEALEGLEKLGEPSAARWVALAAVKDIDPAIRARALKVLSKFQDKRTKDFEDLTERLRKDHEAAVEKWREKQIRKE